MALNGSHLLPGERVVTSRRATALVRPGGGAPDPAGDDGTPAAGRLYLTNLRLVFLPRSARRLPGRLGILLPTVRDLRHTPAGRRWRLDVVTGTQQFSFVVRGVLRLIAETVLRVDVSPAQLAHLAGLARRDLPRTCGAAPLPGTAAETATTPAAPLLDTASALNLAELLRDARLE